MKPLACWLASAFLHVSRVLWAVATSVGGGNPLTVGPSYFFGLDLRRAGSSITTWLSTQNSQSRRNRLRFRSVKEEVSDLDKLPSFDVGEAPRCSTPSLGV
jgi:hypothetical protein